MPAKKSNRVKRGEGNASRRPLNDCPASPSIPSCPDWMPAEGKAEWRRVAPLLDELNILTKLDRASLADYCLTWARLIQAERDITERGLLVPGRNRADGLVKNPAITVARQYRVSLQRWCAAFGLTPDSRGRINYPDDSDAKAQQELDAILSRPRVRRDPEPIVQ